jgi:DUF2905 family protein/opacity-associated protein A-like protein
MHRVLIMIGVVLVLIGLLWPWLGKLPFGRLPGDIRIEKDGFVFFFPIVTGIVISVVLSLIFWLLRK